MSQPSGYSRLQIRLHWITVFLVALQYLLHDGIASAYDQALETGTYAVSAPVIGHAAGGLIILGLVIWRLMLRARAWCTAAARGRTGGLPDPVALGASWVLRAARSFAGQRRDGLGRAAGGRGRRA